MQSQSQNQKFYISDLHIGHTNIIRHDNRPFANMYEMENVIIHNWNAVVKQNDEVYVLGDMFWKPADALRILPQLKGQKYLIMGNHDKVNDMICKYFKEVYSFGVDIKDNGRLVVLCHYPIAHWKNADHGAIHLYGHIHAGRDMRPFVTYTNMMQARGIPYACYNVGCMLPYMNYTPRTLDYIIQANINNQCNY